MRQAIVTKYLGPTNHRGSRIKVTAQAVSKTYPWDDAADVESNHERAATSYALDMGWLKTLYCEFTLVGGALPDDTGYAFVLVRKK